MRSARSSLLRDTNGETSRFYHSEVPVLVIEGGADPPLGVDVLYVKGVTEGRIKRVHLTRDGGANTMASLIRMMATPSLVPELKSPNNGDPPLHKRWPVVVITTGALDTFATFTEASSGGAIAAAAVACRLLMEPSQAIMVIESHSDRRFVEAVRTIMGERVEMLNLQGRSTVDVFSRSGGLGRIHSQLAQYETVFHATIALMSKYRATLTRRTGHLLDPKAL